MLTLSTIPLDAPLSDIRRCGTLLLFCTSCGWFGQLDDAEYYDWYFCPSCDVTDPEFDSRIGMYVRLPTPKEDS